MRQQKRRDIGVPLDAILLISVGELSVRKNHKAVIKALQELDNNYWYVIVGKGDLRDELLALDHTGRLKLLGFRTDIKELLWASDLFVFPSLQEGLPVALMEAMACGLPVIVSNIRGNTDLVDSSGGLLFNPDDIDECKEAIDQLIAEERLAMGIHNRKVIEKFSSKAVTRIMDEIYKNI